MSPFKDPEEIGFRHLKWSVALLNSGPHKMSALSFPDEPFLSEKMENCEETLMQFILYLIHFVVLDIHYMFTGKF